MPNINLLPTSTPGLPTAIAPLSGAPISSNPVNISPDELSSLFPMMLSNTKAGSTISFPTTIFKETFTKDQVLHKYPNIDGARAENMGNNPTIYQVRGIFTNNIDPDPSRGETWVRGTLFPLVFSQVITLLQSKANLILQHPLVGNINVQVLGYDYDLVATGPRDGAYLTINLVETIEPVQPKLSTNIVSAGFSVNTAMQSVGPDFPPPPGLSLSQFFGQMASAIQNITNFPASVVGGINDTSLSIFALPNVLSSFTGGANQLAININTLGQNIGSLTNFNVSGAGIINTNSGNSNSQLPYSTSFQSDIIQLTKLAPLGSPSNPFPSAPGTIVSNSVSAIKPATTSTFLTQKAIQSLTSLNNNKSKNAATFINKCLTATNDTLNYYIAMNRNEVSNIIAALQQMIYTLQQTQANLSQNTRLINVNVKNYTLQTNMSWMQLSMLLQNNIDELISLNNLSINPNYLYIPSNTTISYYQNA